MPIICEHSELVENHSFPRKRKQSSLILDDFSAAGRIRAGVIRPLYK